MSEMVERVAQAIYDAPDPISGDLIAEALTWAPCVGDGGRDQREDIMAICRSAARAAIEAMPPSPEIEELQDKIEGLEADLDSAVSVAWERGATEWVRLNYPRQYKRLAALKEQP